MNDIENFTLHCVCGRRKEKTDKFCCQPCEVNQTSEVQQHHTVPCTLRKEEPDYLWEEAFEDLPF